MAVVFQATWPSTQDPNGTRVLWRALTWKEYKQFSERYGLQDLTYLSPMSLYMEVYELIVQAGPHPSEVLAGIAANVALQQLRNNAFSGQIDSVVQKLVEKRNWIRSNYLDGCRAVVSATFHIPFETMDAWDPDTLFERFAQAEHAVGMQWNPADPRASRGQAQGPAEISPEQIIASEPDPRKRNWLKAKERRRQADLSESGPAGQSVPQAPKDESFSWNR